MMFMTFKELLDEYKIICNKENKEFSAIKLLIYDHFNWNNTELYLKYDEEIEASSLKEFKEKAYQYIFEDIPVQYIMGYSYFYNQKFTVSPAVLIPRFETEILVEKILQYYNEYYINQFVKILDIGTGSGCIAITLKNNIVNSYVEAVDISKEALMVAKQNALHHNADVCFIQSDLFSQLEKDKKYDIIVSNPPYIPYDEKLERIVYNNEPHLALFADNDGMYFYEHILREAENFLQENGLIVFEIGYQQKVLIETLINKYFPKSEYEFYQDFNNHFRVVFIKNYTR